MVYFLEHFYHLFVLSALLGIVGVSVSIRFLNVALISAEPLERRLLGIWSSILFGATLTVTKLVLVQGVLHETSTTTDLPNVLIAGTVFLLGSLFSLRSIYTGNSLSAVEGGGLLLCLFIYFGYFLGDFEALSVATFFSNSLAFISSALIIAIGFRLARRSDLRSNFYAICLIVVAINLIGLTYISWTFDSPILIDTSRWETIIYLFLHTSGSWIFSAFLAHLVLCIALLYLHDLLRRERSIRDYEVTHLSPVSGLPNEKLFLKLARVAFEKRSADQRGMAILQVELLKSNVARSPLEENKDAILISAVADQLKTVSGKLITIGQPRDTVFSIQIISDNEDSVVSAAELIVLEIKKTISQFASEDTVSLASGIAIWPSDSDTVEALLHQANDACQSAKEFRHSSLVRFDTEIASQRRRKVDLASALKTAIQNRELYLLYQPQVSVCEEGVTGFESLIRWEHPVYGLVSPAEFIPIAEETGDIIDIGQWVMEAACKAAASWEGHYRLAINVSPVQLLQPDFIEVLSEEIAKTNFDPSMLELEITETAVIEDAIVANKTIAKVRELGISVAIDDFGSGYSSLNMIVEMPFDKIKLDRSLIRRVNSEGHPASEVLLKSIISLAKSLEISVLAEGVEYASQFKLLKKAGCDEIQGFYFGKPSRL